MIRPACQSCNMPMLLRKQIAGNGVKQVGWYCDACDTWERPVHWLPHSDVAQYLEAYQATIDNIPTIRDYRDVPCAVCGKIGAEMHHWMPQKLNTHPDIKEEWSAWQSLQVPLCKYHHDLWHDLVTPWMSGRGNSRRKDDELSE